MMPASPSHPQGDGQWQRRRAIASIFVALGCLLTGFAAGWLVRAWLA